MDIEGLRLIDLFERSTILDEDTRDKFTLIFSGLVADSDSRSASTSTPFLLKKPSSTASTSSKKGTVPDGSLPVKIKLATAQEVPPPLPKKGGEFGCPCPCTQSRGTQTHTLTRPASPTSTAAPGSPPRGGNFAPMIASPVAIGSNGHVAVLFTFPERASFVH
jgi:hypothetical protein